MTGEMQAAREAWEAAADDDPEFQRWLTSHHEAAHAVAYLQQDVPFRYVTLRPRRGDAAGMVAVQRGQSVRASSMSLIAAAGPVAEWRCLLSAPSDADLGGIFAPLRPGATSPPSRRR